MKKNVFAVIPAYNEEQAIASVIKKVKKYVPNIIVVNDHSADNTSAVAKKEGAYVLDHVINRGAGAATRTGMDYALQLGADYVVTLDADGQHDVEDIPRLLKVKEKADVIIGSRMINPKGMPIQRKIFNWGGSLITFFLYGIYVKDSQSGFKVFNKKALENIQITFDRYEFCSEVIHEINKKRLTVTEVPIKVVYTQYSLNKATHGQNFFNGLKMIYKMIMRLFM